MAETHVTYEVRELLAAVVVPDWPPILVGDPSLLVVRFDVWITHVRLEAVMVHLRCIYAFLTGIGAYENDVIAADYFSKDDGWTPPPFVMGGSVEKQKEIIDNINRRVHHIGQQRLVPFTWADALPHIPVVAEHFTQFVESLVLKGHSDRAAWFSEAVECAKSLAGLRGA